MISFVENTSLIFLDMYEDFRELGFSTSAAKFYVLQTTIPYILLGIKFLLTVIQNQWIKA